MDELVLWLTACIDEDERIARAAGGRSEQTWRADLSGVDPIGGKSWPLVVRYVTGDQLRGAVAHLPVMQERSEDRMAHIAAHDPARVLREINAKRQVLTRYAELVDRVKELSAIRDRLSAQGRSTVMTDGELESAIHQRDALLGVLRLLALPYADRPTYREEWAP